jgi:hypothetical protein
MNLAFKHLFSVFKQILGASIYALESEALSALL